MAKPIKPTQEEIEIIREISKSPEKYSICIKDGEVFRGESRVGRIRRKFIPFMRSYQHNVINPARRIMRQIAICPYWKNISERRQIWEDYSAVVDSVNYNQSFSDITEKIERIPYTSRVDMQRICSC
jgi:hypothetical protein